MIEILKHFSSTYSKARHKFLEAAKDAGAQIQNIQHPYEGPNGEPLFTDVAEIGPSDAQNILVLSSGTHGVEGFTGSGIQTGFLRDEITSHLSIGLGFLFIHAINPFGLAHLRRVNENNIDLNYNFGDHSGAYEKNPTYDQLANAINPESMSPLSEIASWSRLLSRLIWLTITKRGKELEAAISGGQYNHPKGLFYGGRFETWSNRTIREIAQHYLYTKNKVVFIDFHTGLGKFGNAELMVDVEKESKRFERAFSIWGNKYVHETPLGVPLTRSLKLAYPKMLPNSEVTAVSLEYGTITAIKVLKALRLENWIHHHGGKDHPNFNKIKTQLLRAFYPEQDEWKYSAWRIGKDVIEKAVSSLQKTR